jgi:hypothetical protein
MLTDENTHFHLLGVEDAGLGDLEIERPRVLHCARRKKDSSDDYNSRR